MRQVPLIVLMSMLAAGHTSADTNSFDILAKGPIEQPWLGGVTGAGSPLWIVEADASAPSQPNVLKQSGEGKYPWCVQKEVMVENGFVETKFKAISGQEDQAGGLVWRWKSGEEYYVVRANALENNITIYHTTHGIRRSFMNVNKTVTPVEWHTLRVDFQGNQFKVTFDGEAVLEAQDDTIQGAGAVGLWTKADSITTFDDFVYKSVEPTAASPVTNTANEK